MFRRFQRRLVISLLLTSHLSAGFAAWAKDKEKDKPAHAKPTAASRPDSNAHRSNSSPSKEAPRQRVESAPRAERRNDNHPPVNTRSMSPAKTDHGSAKREEAHRDQRAHQERNPSPNMGRTQSADSHPATNSRTDRNKLDTTSGQQRDARSNHSVRHPEGHGGKPQLGVIQSGGQIPGGSNSRNKDEPKPIVRTERSNRRDDDVAKPNFRDNIVPQPNAILGTINLPGTSNGAVGRQHGSQHRTTPLKIEKNGHVPKRDAKPEFALQQSEVHDRVARLHQARDHKDFDRQLKELRSLPDAKLHSHVGGVKLERVSGVYQQRIERHDFRQLHESDVGRRLNLDRQFQLHRHGDLARQMNLGLNLNQAGGWQHRHHGTVIPTYTRSSFSVWYAGGGYYPRYCWTPRWTPWVDWCWWDTCQPIYDPRPYYCRPIVYTPCSTWVVYEYPVWQPLPVVTCGTWVDVPPVVVDSGTDLQLLATRFVDNGHPDQNLGPRYRVWLRNNGPLPTTLPFNVVLLAANGPVPTPDLPQAGAVVNGIESGEVKSVDIRLPLAANRLGVSPEGDRIPFQSLHVLIDSHRDLVESNEANNGSVVARQDILPVDPAAFSADVSAGAPGTVINVAGEGFGPEPGQVIVSINGLQLQAEIHGWYDLGVRLALPNLSLAGPTDADILIVRGDGAAANPIDFDLVPPTMMSESPLPPLPSP